MVVSLTESKLKTGETVSTAVVHGPDLEWADRIAAMLAHKGDPWNWQNSELLREPVGVSARFYVLHRDGRPFSHIMLVAASGLAFLGHVWTEPADRGVGASAILMDLVLEQLRQKDFPDIILGTEPGSAAYHYYERRGFVPVAAGSGYMLLSDGSVSTFFQKWFGREPEKIELLNWSHWPASAPLCLGDFPDQVRLAATGLFGRASSERALLPMLRQQRQSQVSGGPDCAVALVAANGAVWGFGVADAGSHLAGPGCSRYFLSSGRVVARCGDARRDTREIPPGLRGLRRCRRHGQGSGAVGRRVYPRFRSAGLAAGPRRCGPLAEGGLKI